MHRRAPVLGHRLEASERGELALGLEQTFHGLCSQRPNQLVFELGNAREESERFKGLVGRHRDGRMSERTADMPLVGSVAFSFDEHQRPDRCGGSHACISEKRDT